MNLVERRDSVNEDKNAPSSQGAQINIKLGKNVFKIHVSEFHQEEPRRNSLVTYHKKIAKQISKIFRTIRLRLKNVLRR